MQGVFRRSMECPGPIVNGSRLYNCGRPMVLKKTSDRADCHVWRCRRVHEYKAENKTYKTKDVKVSIRENSWLLDSKLSLEHIVEFIYLWSAGFNTEEIQHELKLSKRTIIEWSAYLRSTCFTVVMDESCQIGRHNVHVEIDESKFGKRKYYRGHRVEGQWVFGGREKEDPSKVFMVPVKNRKQTTLLPLIQKWIRPGSIIHSDCWKAYNCLGTHGYKHITVNHSKEFKNIATGACTNSIESDWRHAKVSFPRYGVQKGFHAGYLAEFMWRRKFRDTDKFLTLLKHLTDTFNNGKMCTSPQ